MKLFHFKVNLIFFLHEYSLPLKGGKVHWCVTFMIYNRKKEKTPSRHNKHNLGEI